MRARVSIDYLPDGSLPIYPAAKWNLVTGENGTTALLVTKPKKVIVPLSEMEGITNSEVESKFRIMAAILKVAAIDSMKYHGHLHIIAAIRTDTILPAENGDIHLLMAGMIACPSPVMCPRLTMLSSLVDFTDEEIASARKTLK
jgi:hypothetical protein